MCRLEAVAVGAQDSKILETVVVSVAIDVIELDRNAAIRRTFAPSTQLASWLLQTRSEQPLLQVVCARVPTCDEDLVQWQRRVRNKLASDIPALPCEVGRVELKTLDLTSNMFEVATSWH
jgi:hypothetical protein